MPVKDAKELGDPILLARGDEVFTYGVSGAGTVHPANVFGLLIGVLSDFTNSVFLVLNRGLLKDGDSIGPGAMFASDNAVPVRRLSIGDGLPPFATIELELLSADFWNGFSGERNGDLLFTFSCSWSFSSSFRGRGVFTPAIADP